MYQLNRKSDNPITVMKLKHWVWQDHWLQTTARKSNRIVVRPQAHIPKDVSPGAMKLLKGTVTESQRLTFYYLFIIVILKCTIEFTSGQWLLNEFISIVFSYWVVWPLKICTWNEIIFYSAGQKLTSSYSAAQIFLCGLNFMHHYPICTDCPFDSNIL